jgi:hypothetical protein
MAGDRQQGLVLLRRQARPRRRRLAESQEAPELEAEGGDGPIVLVGKTDRHFPHPAAHSSSRDKTLDNVALRYISLPPEQD